MLHGVPTNITAINKLQEQFSFWLDVNVTNFIYSDINFRNNNYKGSRINAQGNFSLSE